MCEENFEWLKACETKGQAVYLYKKTIDWALEKNFPPINFIRNEFSECENLGLFVDVDFHGELLDEHQCYVFHNCRGYITVDLNVVRKIIPMLYFANNCNMRIFRADSPHTLPIKVPIYIYGENSILAEDSDDIIFIRKGGVQ